MAVVGRPNVGKSTLLNRIVGRREAIVEERPGVTRDRKAVEAEWCGRSFTVVDTGGWQASGGALDAQVSAQAERAWKAADVVLLVVDVTVGLSPEDTRVANQVRGGGPPVLVVANKVDGHTREPDIWEFVGLGLGDPWPVSALHGRGTGDLLDEVVARASPELDDEALAADAREAAGEEVRVPGVAIVGRPNVGKSTLFNRLIGDERAVVHDLPGTTRDSIDTEIETPEGRAPVAVHRHGRHAAPVAHRPGHRVLLPGAGLAGGGQRRAGRARHRRRRGVTHQDQRLAERIDAAGCPTVILMNKWETLDAEARADVTAQVADRLHFLATSPVIKGSALTGKSIHKLVPALAQAVDAYRRRVPTRELNQVLQAAQVAHPSPVGRVLYATQGATEPPTFTLFTNRDLAPTYLRYLERSIREHFELGNTPVKLRVRRR